MFISLFAVMLLFFLIGLLLALVSIRKSRNKPRSGTLLIVFMLIECATGYFETFHYMDAMQLQFGVIIHFLKLAIVGGPIFFILYCCTKRIWLNLVASSFFLSAGLCPLIWFSFLERFVQGLS
jgi:hypothetical protein